MRTLWQSLRLDLERAPVRLWSALGMLEAYGATLALLPAAPGPAAPLTQDWRDRAASGTLAAEAAGQGALDPEVAAVVAAYYDEIDRRAESEKKDGDTDKRDGRDALTPQILCADNAATAEIAQAAGLLGEGGMGSLSDQFAEGPQAWAKLNQYRAWLNGPEFAARPGEAVQTAVLRALGAHLFLLRLAPFRHCNDATARLAGYRILRAAGLPTMAAHGLTAHFAATAEEYAELVDEASDSGGATFAFVGYAVAGLIDALHRQVAALGAAQQANTWRDQIAELFDGRTKTGDLRRRMLAEALGREDAPVRIGRLRYLTPQLAEAYAGKSAKTLSRDVRWLESEGLVRRTLHGVAALRDGVEAKQAA